jgi:hypothetical protein
VALSGELPKGSVFSSEKLSLFIVGNMIFVGNSKLFNWKQGVTHDYHYLVGGLDPTNT